jgi:hypothetical protein
VNRAARVEGHAAGGQVLASKAVCDDAGLTRTALLAQHQLVLVDLGEFELKGIKTAERLFQVLPERLAHRTFAAAEALPDKTHLPASFLAQGGRGASYGGSRRGGGSGGDGGLFRDGPQWWRVVSKGKVPVRASAAGDAFELGLLAPGDQVEVSGGDPL